MNNSLIGKIEVQFYDKENNLKRVVNGKNTITHKGIKRLCEILTQGFKKTFVETESLHEVPLDTLSNQQKSMGLNIVEWKNKENTTFSYSENIKGFEQTSNLFKDNNQSADYAYTSKNSFVSDNLKSFYFPSESSEITKDNSGWVCDLGLKNIYRKEFVFTQNPTYLCEDFGVPYTNIKYKSLKMIDESGYELQEGVDYDVLDWGDCETPPQIYFYKDDDDNYKFLNVPLYLTYSYFNVPKVPIVGFTFDCFCSDDGTIAAKNFISGWSWSLNQGKSKLPHLFPNLSGCMSGNAISTIDNNVLSNNMHQAVWFTPLGQNEKRFYIHSYPYGVINPTQLVWYAHLQNDSKCYFKNFSLLTMELPKFGPQVIQLGSGKNQPSPDDTKLTSPIPDTKMLISHNVSNNVDSVKFELKLGFENCNSDSEIAEIGLFFSEDDDTFYSDSEYWNNYHHKDISGNNRIVKFDGINKDKCNTMFSHGLFETPWKKKKDEKVTIIYTVQINWGSQNE